MVLPSWRDRGIIMARKPRSANQTSTSAPDTPEARLDDKLKAMFEAIERRSGSHVLPDLGSLPRARSNEEPN